MAVAKYRDDLPQIKTTNKLYITDGGLETDLIFLRNVDLPEFASFPLLDTESGIAELKSYLEDYLQLAVKNKHGLVLEAATWRANKDWSDKLGISREKLAELVKKSIAVLDEARSKYETEDSPMVLSGNIGPRGDGYKIGDSKMSVEEAFEYHEDQISTFAQGTNADQVMGATLNYPEEAIGIVKAAQKYRIPSIISFTVEKTDAKLPCGLTLAEAIEAVDKATDQGPAYYMINCAHVSHFEALLEDNKDAKWFKRVRALRTNASRKSHEELDQSDSLDAGDPDEFGKDHVRLVKAFPHLNIIGGCCGTDIRHVRNFVETFQK